MTCNKVIFLYILGKKARIIENDPNSLYFGSWSGLLSSYISKIEPEVTWFNIRQDRSVVNEMAENIDGVYVEIFPFENRMLFGILSYKLLKRLKVLTSDRSAIIHCFNAHSLSSYLLVWLFRNNPIVLTNYGHTPPRFLMKNTKSLLKKTKLILFYLLERIVYRYVDGFTPSGEIERKYLKATFPNLRVAEFDHLGIDFSFFKPLGKKYARDKLRLPADSKILLYVGHLYELKGVDTILKSYMELRNSVRNLKLILVGASEQDSLYSEAILSGAIVVGRVGQELLRLYYSASDVYLLPNFKSKEFVNFGGIGTAILEAMACNTPVVSTHLVHFPLADRYKIGVIPENPSDLSDSIRKVLDNPNEFSDCRQAMGKYYDRNIIGLKLLEIYKLIS